MRAATPSEEFLPVKNVAARLGVSYNSIIGAINNGTLVAYRFGPRGGSYRIHEDDLADYIAASRTKKKKSCAQPRSKKTTAPFQKLDTQRLLRAWQSQGSHPAPHGEATG